MLATLKLMVFYMDVIHGQVFWDEIRGMRVMKIGFLPILSHNEETKEGVFGSLKAWTPEKFPEAPDIHVLRCV